MGSRAGADLRKSDTEQANWGVAIPKLGKQAAGNTVDLGGDVGRFVELFLV